MIMLTATSLAGVEAAAYSQGSNVLAAAALEDGRTLVLLGSDTAKGQMQPGYRVTTHIRGDDEFGQGYYHDDERAAVMRFAQLLGEAVV